MNNATKIGGSLIKYHRERLGITQKELCQGICVVSHLSKIENNKVEPSPEIVVELFNKLGMEYYNDAEFINTNREKIDKFFTNLNYHRKTNYIFEDIRKEKDKFLSSPLIIDYLLLEAYSAKSKSNIKRLSELEIYMDTNQEGWFYLFRARYSSKKSKDTIRDWILKGHGLLRNSFSFITLMEFELTQGHFEKVLELGPEIMNLAIIEGNAMAIAHGNILMGNGYAAQNLPDLMLSYYKRAENILLDLNRQDLIASINYNIGATYFESSEYEKALFYLEKVEKQNTIDDYTRFLLYHKLGLLYLRLDNNDIAKEYIERAKEMLNSVEGNYKINSLMLEVAELQLEKDYLDNPIYLEKLEKLCKILDKKYPIGFYLFHKRMLEHLYCHLRQYKKAYLLK
ncbi:MAG: helix-turn-helix domain-containing protein [Tissierellia bacterium]|nr:helix-turn-helix domain-containing protein [Tissierellia bacterium]